jgi:hypothetical protein
MQTALLILLVCAAADLIACSLLLVLVWFQHQGLRKEAARSGEKLPSAAGQFGCLLAFGLAGLVLIYGIGWFLLS